MANNQFRALLIPVLIGLVSYLLTFFIPIPFLSSSSSSDAKPLSAAELEIIELANGHHISPVLISESPFVLYIPSFLSNAESSTLLKAADGHFEQSGYYGTEGDQGSSTSSSTKQQQDGSDVPRYRTSSSAVLDSTANISRIMTTRAMSFLANLTSASSTEQAELGTNPYSPYPPSPFQSLPSVNLSSLSYYGLESPQLVRYHSRPAPQYYNAHNDHFDFLLPDSTVKPAWWQGGQGMLYNRVASFFVYVEVDKVEGGGTYFPEVTVELEENSVDSDSSHSNDEAEKPGPSLSPSSPQLKSLQSQGLIALGHQEQASSSASSSSKEKKPKQKKKKNQKKDTTKAKGVTFLPQPGAAVFWINLQPSGLGDDRTLHAGLPVTAGRKVGMNLWVKRGFGF